MEDYRKKSNHEILKEIQNLEKEHVGIKENLLIKLEEYIKLETEMIGVEEKYKNLVSILKERM